MCRHLNRGSFSFTISISAPRIARNGVESTGLFFNIPVIRFDEANTGSKSLSLYYEVGAHRDGRLSAVGACREFGGCVIHVGLTVSLLTTTSSISTTLSRLAIFEEPQLVRTARNKDPADCWLSWVLSQSSIVLKNECRSRSLFMRA